MSVDIITNAIENIVQNNLVNIHTALLGKISNYDYKTHKADIKPVIKRKLNSGEIVDIPVIPSVPVLIDRNNDYIHHRPIKKGDYVLIVFCERSIDSWVQDGNENAPLDTRKYHLNDAIAIPGVAHFKKNSLAKNNEDVLIKFKNSEIVLSNSGDIEVKSDNKGLEIAKNGEISLKNSIGAIKIDSLGKIAMGIPTAELLQLFDLTLDAIIADALITPPTKALLTTIKALLQTIKGTL